MRRYLLFLMAGILILCWSSHVLAEVEIKAQVDKNTLTADELLTYKLIITSTKKNTPLPQVPKFEGFKIISQAESTSISLAKSNIKSIIVYAFILQPREPGKLKIEPSQIKFKGKTYQSEGFGIKVTPAESKPFVPYHQEPDLSPESPKEPAQRITL